MLPSRQRGFFNIGFHASRGTRRRTRPLSRFPLPSFFAKLADLGSGVVDLGLVRGVGAATFTRATAAACKLASGLWKLDVASGVPRSHYLGANTAAGDYLGYLPIPQAINLALWSRDLTQADWAKVTMGNGLTSTGIDGVANSCTRLTALAATATILQTVVAAATSRTFSAFVKRVTGTGTILLKHGTQTLDITALINTTTFTRVELNANELNVAFGFQINTDTDVIDVDCNQFEADAFASPPIVTTTVAVTANADVLTYGYPGNADAAVGACSAEVFSIPTGSTGGARSAVTINTGTTGAALKFTAGAVTLININDGTNNVSKTGLTNASTVQRKRASSWGDGVLSVTGDGEVVATGVFDGSMGVAGIGVGASVSGTNQLFGAIQKVKYFTHKPAAEMLQAMSVTP